MEIGKVRRFLGWCLIFNFVVLMAWFCLWMCANDWLYRLHGEWFPMPPETFAAIHYAGIAFYKMLVLVFNAIPLLALWAMDRRVR